MIILFFLALLYGAIRYFNIMRVTNETLKLGTEVSALNTRLHVLVAKNEIKASDDEFVFLKTLLCNSVEFLSSINLWVIVYINFKYRKLGIPPIDLEVEKRFSYNTELKNILAEYKELSHSFIHSKSKLSIFVFNTTMKTIEFITSIFNRKRGVTFLNNFKRLFTITVLQQNKYGVNWC